MRMGKRMLALNLALLLVVVLLPLQALAATITLDTPATVTRSEDALVTGVDFTAPESGFYQLEMTCPDYPGYQVLSDASSAPGLHVYASVGYKEQYCRFGKDPIFPLMEGTTYSFVSYLCYGEDGLTDHYCGEWTCSVSRVDPQPLTFGVPEADTVHLYSFTAQRSGAVQVARTDWGDGDSCYIYSDTYEEVGWLSHLGTSGAFNFNAEAGKTYYITDADPTGEIVVRTPPRSGVLGDNGKVRWTLSDDGVLTISGTDTLMGGVEQLPWAIYADEITKVVIRNDAAVTPLWYMDLPNLQELDVGSRENYSWKDGALYYTHDPESGQCTLMWVRPDVKTLELAENVKLVNFSAFQHARALETLTVRSYFACDYGIETLLYGATALKDIYYYDTELDYTPFYGLYRVVDLNYKDPAPVVHYMAADQEQPIVRGKIYPATRVGVCEMLYDYNFFDGNGSSYAGSDLQFTDVGGLTAKQRDAIATCVNWGITQGVSETQFAPDLPCTRGQIVTMLYRAQTGTSRGVQMPYTDVNESDYYYEPVWWCYGNPDITFVGTTDTTFGPNVQQKEISLQLSVLTKDGVEYQASSKTITIFPDTHTHDTELRNAKPATCTEKGYTGDQVCKLCGEVVSQGQAIPVKNHSYGAWNVTKAATEQAAGVETRTCSVCGKTETRSIPKLTPKPVANPFRDVKNGDYFFDPVLWALNHDPQITDGMTETTFAPGETCTRGQVVTFLWRAMGCKEPTRTGNPFTDVASGDYFYKAVLWAVEKGITDGTSATTFSPNDPCTRAHVVTFLHRAEGTPSAGSGNPFNDVASGQYYTDAVLWAVSKGITDGTSETTFSPAAPCTRGQIVTFLYRDMK